MAIQFNKKTGGRGIEWCDETRNVTGGCMHGCRWVMPDGTVVICYAEDLAEHGVASAAYPNGFAHHYFRPAALGQLGASREPQLIFADSMSDLFAANVPREHVLAVLDAMRNASHHVFQLLTKAAPQLTKYVDSMPPNVWVGVSSPPDWFMERRLSQLQQQAMLHKSLRVLADVKRHTGNIVWMSAEPVSWDLTSVINDSHPLDWIVIGAASDGPRYYQPDAEHIRRLLDVMDLTQTPVFFKGNIAPMFVSHDLGTDEFNRWREDFPRRYRDGSPIPAVERRQRRCREHRWTLSRPYAPSLASIGGLPT